MIIENGYDNDNLSLIRWGNNRTATGHLGGLSKAVFRAESIRTDASVFVGR